MFSVAAGAQTAPAQRTGDWCGTTAAQDAYFAQHPGAREAQKALFERLEVLEQAQARTGGNAARTPDITIPVVVHVIHSGGTDNISDRQINSAIDQLNTDYQKMNGDTINTLPAFQPIAAYLGFRFKLAKKDPNGDCTTGITRHFAPSLVNDNQTGAVQAVSVWDPARYLNIWVVGSIGVPVGGGIVLGYSYLPPNAPSGRDGFVVRNDYFGNQGTSSPNRALTRTATHEIGHYFGLLHPWGSTNSPGSGVCTGTDNVADTPTTDGTFNCDLAYAPCGVLANVQNFMDYAACPTMFTNGQKTRMRSILSLYRANLTTAANLVSTGTDDSYQAPDCAPIARFAVAPGTSTNVCVNSTVTLRDYSYNYSAGGGPLTYTWSMPGGNPSSATGASVTVTYPAAGFYTVTETVSNSAGSNSVTQTNYIQVEGPGGGETAPLVQSFENAAFPNLYPAPTLRNYQTFGTTSAGTVSNAYAWTRQTASAPTVAADGMAFLVVGNRSYPASLITTLITPNISLSGQPSTAVVRFARSYALRYTTSTDQLRVSFSTDCGQTWSSPALFDALALSTKGATPIDAFSPTAAADWQDLSVAIPATFQGSGTFKIRFQMVNGTQPGNNFYFDNLRVSIGLPTKAEALASRGISLFPNPLTNETALHLNLAAPAEVQVRLTDVVGREVLRLPAKTFAAGQQTLSLQPAAHALRAGVYVVRITLNGETFSSKLSVE
nr:M43 family zinc metalloprotease [Hymenobacter cyanobacteriorum]